MIQCNRTSDDTPDYNCIAWAAKDDSNFWWPVGVPPYYWPDGVEFRETIEAFTKAYETRGFKVCSNAIFEDGFEKIAIYVDPSNRPKHAARQLDKDNWTSKLGSDIDISHPFINQWSQIIVDGKIYDLSIYGKLGRLMKKVCN